MRAHEDACWPARSRGSARSTDVTLHGAAARPHADADVHRRRAAPRPRSPRALAEREIAVWDGNYYACELERFLGLAPHGAVRAGFVHYNDERDAERLLDAVESL